MRSADSCSRKLRNQGCAVQRGGTTVWFGVAESRGNYSNAFVLPIKSSKQFERPSREILSPILSSNKLTWLLGI